MEYLSEAAKRCMQDCIYTCPYTYKQTSADFLSQLIFPSRVFFFWFFFLFLVLILALCTCVCVWEISKSEELFVIVCLVTYFFVFFLFFFSCCYFWSVQLKCLFNIGFVWKNKNKNKKKTNFCNTLMMQTYISVQCLNICDFWDLKKPRHCSPQINAKIRLCVHLIHFSVHFSSFGSNWFWL